MKRTPKINVIIPAEQFAIMSSSEICQLINNNPSYAIVGGKRGVDRKIIDISNLSIKEWNQINQK